VFIGEVVEVIESAKYESQAVEGEAIGFKVKVTQSVQTPKQAPHFLVYPLGLTASCGLRSDSERLREQFPPGARQGRGKRSDGDQRGRFRKIGY
jgi:hypothetical protein